VSYRTGTLSEIRPDNMYQPLYASLKKEQNNQILPQSKREKIETPTHKA